MKLNEQNGCGLGSHSGLSNDFAYCFRRRNKILSRVWAPGNLLWKRVQIITLHNSELSPTKTSSEPRFPLSLPNTVIKIMQNSEQNATTGTQGTFLSCSSRIVVSKWKREAQPRAPLISNSSNSTNTYKWIRGFNVFWTRYLVEKAGFS